MKNTVLPNTDTIILELRKLGETMYKAKPKNANLIIQAADRLEELDERVAIMEESFHSGDGPDMDFPPVDDIKKG